MENRLSRSVGPPTAGFRLRYTRWFLLNASKMTCPPGLSKSTSLLWYSFLMEAGKCAKTKAIASNWPGLKPNVGRLTKPVIQGNIMLTGKFQRFLFAGFTDIKNICIPT